MTGATRQSRSRIWADGGWPARGGRVLGGSSSINGMVYVRGHARDFDHWADQGADGWRFADVLPYFRRMENWQPGASPWRGQGGPLHVSRGKRENPLFAAFVEAGRQAGYPVTEDYNGAQQEGFRRDGGDDPRGPALVRRARLFAPCDGHGAGACGARSGRARGVLTRPIAPPAWLCKAGASATQMQRSCWRPAA